MTSSVWFIVVAAGGDGVRVQFNAVELFHSLESRVLVTTPLYLWMDEIVAFWILTRTFHTPHVLFNTPVFHFHFHCHANRHNTHALNRPFFPFVAFFLSFHRCFFFLFPLPIFCHSLVCIHNFSIIGSSHTKISSKPYRVIQSCNQMLCSYLHGYVKLNLT